MFGKRIIRNYFPLSLFVILFLLNPWVYKLVNQALFIFLVLLFYLLVLVTNQIKKSFSKVVVILFIFLVILQVKTVNIANVYKSTPAEIDLQTTRMNYYEPRYARLGYYLEKQPITTLFYKVEKNFFDVIDLNLYFPDYFNLISLPFILIGLFKLFQSKYVYKYLILTSVIMLTLVGVNGYYGPFLIFPLFGLAIIVGLKELVGQVWSKK